MVRIAELPAVIDVGAAVIVTVGVDEPTDDTVIVEFAVAEPPGPVAVAVYVVVATGLTDCVPPASGSVYELPSEPVIVTFVAFAALTDSMEAAPEATEAGLAEMLTEGRASVILPLTPPHPTRKSADARPRNPRDTNRRSL